jgi:putative CocE/NonD family hydrolase
VLQPIRTIEHVWIPLPDGSRLAARIWLPVDAEQQPVPALLEYLPYRKNDGTARRDMLRHPYLAGHGYASVRVDMRGSGDSDGLLLDEYLAQEQDDALEVLAWLAAQPWCTGDIGIFGKSWGGFNALQIAARQPPQLKAVISIYSTDDRYADDVHYIGGCIQGLDMLAWASVMLAGNALPPDPAVVGDVWRDIWHMRMQQTPPYVEEWLRHQRRDAFWKHGSVNEDFSAITCAVYAVGGWADGYTNAVTRLLTGLSCPRKGLIGPWAHEFPEVAEPAPAIGFLQESLRWWDYWLKGVDTGIMDEPMLRAWIQDWVTPATAYIERPGRWVAEENWPSPRITHQALDLGSFLPAPPRNALPPAEPAPGPWKATSIAQHGMGAGAWCAYGHPGDYPPDQHAEDSTSLCFTSPTLDEPVEILGFPRVRLRIAADQPCALVAVRLCDIAPDGSSLLVSRGALNLTHRDSHEHPSPLQPGEPYEVTVQLNAAGHRRPAGHRWRLAIAPTYWPHVWPSPTPVTLTISQAQLELPVRPARDQDAALVPFAPPETTPPLPVETVRPAARRRTNTHDLITGAYIWEDEIDSGGFQIIGDGLVYTARQLDRYGIVDGDPLSAQAESEHQITIERGDWRTCIQTQSSMSCDATHFHLFNMLEAYEGENRVFAKTWTCVVPRDLV